MSAGVALFRSHARIRKHSGGTIKGGDSPGTLTINGNYTQGSGGKLLTEIDGTGAGLLAITSNATLAGKLHISLLYGLVTTNGETFDILNYTGTMTGMFAGGITTSPFDTNGSWLVFYGTLVPNEVIIEAKYGTAVSTPEPST